MKLLLLYLKVSCNVIEDKITRNSFNILEFLDAVLDLKNFNVEREENLKFIHRHLKVQP